MTVELVSQLRTIGEEMRSWEERGNTLEILEPTGRLQEATRQVASAWSGSCFGYQSRVYYERFAVPPPGAHFSSEWGLHRDSDWREYQYDEVVRHIYHHAGDPDLTCAQTVSNDARKAFQDAQADVASILSAFLDQHNDGFLAPLKSQVENIVAPTKAQGLTVQLPKGAGWSRDSLAMSQGLQTAPHQEVIAEVGTIQLAFTACSELATLSSRAAAHIDRLTMAQTGTRAQGQSVFIGHGRSLLWRELKDFIQDRLHLSWEEFNRIPIAGVTNSARLAQMLDASGIALLILTAEDEHIDGSTVARQNVVHEAGLFQGRLGFTHAIVLLEEGCDEFTNIQGLGHIHFPHGRIGAAFEEVRRVLEREGFLDMQ